MGAQVTTWSAKYIIARDRPANWDLIEAHSPAFPSGHATAAISVYGFIAYSVWRTIQTKPRARFEVVFWGAVAIALIGFSRIYLSVHFLSDVASGYLVGGFWLAVGGGRHGVAYGTTVPRDRRESGLPCPLDPNGLRPKYRVTVSSGTLLCASITRKLVRRAVLKVSNHELRS